ncbi:MAG: putative O-methyltransferase [Phycisphaerae bacterium]|nr:putative O-methyltransferase [Phycisphaerae bacterium]
MSESNVLLTAQHLDYIASHTRAEDSFLQELKAAARASGIPAIWISPEQAGFIQILLKLCRARTVIEVGTLAGYSAINLARALPADGCVHTIEINPAHADFAASWIRRSDVAGRIKVYRGSGRDLLPALPIRDVDALFLDADKASYPFYLREGMRLLRTGGLILADNAFAFGELFATQPQDRETTAMRQFNELIATQTGLQAIIVPFGDGCWVAVKE